MTTRREAGMCRPTEVIDERQITAERAGASGHHVAGSRARSSSAASTGSLYRPDERQA